MPRAVCFFSGATAWPASRPEESGSCIYGRFRPGAGQVFALGFSDEHLSSGSRYHRQAPCGNRVVEADRRCREALSLIRSGSTAGPGSLPMACLTATSQTVAALT